jgi:hypothetical protein
MLTEPERRRIQLASPLRQVQSHTLRRCRGCAPQPERHRAPARAAAGCPLRASIAWSHRVRVGAPMRSARLAAAPFMRAQHKAASLRPIALAGPAPPLPRARAPAGAHTSLSLQPQVARRRRGVEPPAGRAGAGAPAARRPARGEAERPGGGSSIGATVGGAVGGTVGQGGRPRGREVGVSALSCSARARGAGTRRRDQHHPGAPRHRHRHRASRHPLRTNRTRRVLHPVLIGHAASFTPY